MAIGSMMGIARRAAVLAALLLAVAGAALAAPTFPPLTGRVVDQAGILPPEAEISLDQKLSALEAATTDQFVVVTLKTLGGYDIADYGYQLGRAWGIGQKDKNNGVLLIVAPNERAVRIEVGYGLEGDLTDAVTRLIIENAILPKFRSGDMAAGIVAGTDDVIKVLSGDAAAFKERAAAAQKPANQSWENFVPLIIFLFIFLFVVIRAFRSQPRRRRGPWGWTVGPGWSSGSGWSSGGGFSGGGGGFSGGGGSFGGGGSSGSW